MTFTVAHEVLIGGRRSTYSSKTVREYAVVVRQVRLKQYESSRSMLGKRFSFQCLAEIGFGPFHERVTTFSMRRASALLCFRDGLLAVCHVPLYVDVNVNDGSESNDSKRFEQSIKAPQYQYRLAQTQELRAAAWHPSGAFVCIALQGDIILALDHTLHPLLLLGDDGIALKQLSLAAFATHESQIRKLVWAPCYAADAKHNSVATSAAAALDTLCIVCDRGPVIVARFRIHGPATIGDSYTLVLFSQRLRNGNLAQCFRILASLPLDTHRTECVVCVCWCGVMHWN
jgi:WD repeat-containing and planar cell polarity effector protein Fritz